MNYQDIVCPFLGIFLWIYELSKKLKLHARSGLAAAPFANMVIGYVIQLMLRLS